MDRERLKAKIDPAVTALLVIDMQKDYCCEGGTFHKRGFDVRPAQEVAGKINLFREKTRGLLKQVIHIKMTKVPGLSSPVSAELYRRLGVERNYDPAFAEFHEVLPADGETIIPKYGYSGFVSTYLDQFLRVNGIKTLVLTGIATNVCVDTTARDAFMRGYYVVVPSDLTEGTSPEAKKSALLNIDGFYGEVVQSQDLLTCWGVT